MNPYGRSAQEQREHDALRYPGSDVLINKADLRTASALEVFEREAVADRLHEGLPPAAREVSPDGLKAIHRHLLQDVYEWAGEHRRYTTGRGQAPFAVPEMIQPSLDGMFRKLAQEDALRRTSADAFAARAAHYVNEINAAHPFVEGNGRVQRVWLRNLAEQAGHHLEFRPGDREGWYRASALGFYRNDDAMTALLAQRLGRKQERDTPAARMHERLLGRTRSQTTQPSKDGDRER